MEEKLKEAYLQGFADGRAYAAAVLAGLEQKQRPEGYWHQAKTRLTEELSDE